MAAGPNLNTDELGHLQRPSQVARGKGPGKQRGGDRAASMPPLDYSLEARTLLCSPTGGEEGVFGVKLQYPRRTDNSLGEFIEGNSLLVS